MFRKLWFQVTLCIILLAAMFAAFGVFTLYSLERLEHRAQDAFSHLGMEEGPEYLELAEEHANISRFVSAFLILTLLSAIGLIVLVVPVFVVSSRVITEGIAHFRRGELDYRIPLASSNEFGVIAAYLNDAISEIEKSRSRQLAKSEEKLRHLIERISDIVTVLTSEGNVMYESPSIEPVLGYKPQDLIGKNIFGFIHPADHDRVQRVFQKRLKINGFAPAIVFRFRHKNGTWRYLEAVNNNLFDDPDIRGFLVTSKDVTDRRQSEEKLRELDDLKNTFIRVVSHQLRTPLNAIRWNLELILAGQMGKIAPRQRGLVRVSYHANTEIIRRIDDLLTAMDIEEGRFQFKREPYDVADIVQSVVSESRKLAEMKNIRISFLPPKQDTTTECDPEKTRNIVQRLVENAIRYSQEKGRVDVKLAVRAATVRFEISDHGIGIPASEQNRIFTRFYRASNASVMQPDSSGLGLYIAKFFVERQGGTIGFTSREGKGSTFWFELPLRS